MIKRELGIFLIVGVLTVLVDFLSYTSLVWFHIASVNISKATGFVSGTLFAYFANRFWTFGHNPHKSGSAWRFTILYATTLAVNVMINSSALKLFSDPMIAVQLAFLLATGTSASLNFLGMKLFVFRAAPVSELK